MDRPDLTLIDKVMHYTDLEFVAFYTRLAKVATIKLTEGSKQAMVRVTEGWVYADEDDLEMLRGKYVNLAEKVTGAKIQ